MVFKLLKSLRQSSASEQGQQRGSGAAQTGLDPEALARIARLKIEDRQAVDAARQRLSESYQAFLSQLDGVYRAKSAEQRRRIEVNYELWAAMFELVKGNFKDLWAFLGVVDADVEGWHRISPSGSHLGFMSLGSEGYSFAAGIEQNSKRGAPYPKKWVTVALAHTTAYASGIGDERMLGRGEAMDEHLVGLENCRGKNIDQQEAGVTELVRRATSFPLIFTLSSGEHGQHTTEVPISALEKFTLTEMMQPLIVALTHDDLRNARQLLPSKQRLMLK